MVLNCSSRFPPLTSSAQPAAALPTLSFMLLLKYNRNNSHNTKQSNMKFWEIGICLQNMEQYKRKET